MKNNHFTYQQRIDALRATKMKHTQEKWDEVGILDYDDYPLILPPVEFRKKIHLVSASGLEITDVLYTKFQPKSNHPSGGFFGARICGENFRKMLEVHPVYIDPVSSLAGAFMMILLSYPGFLLFVRYFYPRQQAPRMSQPEILLPVRR